MGATNFSTQATGPSPQQAYHAACREAEHEHGHNSYNGTISTTASFTITELDQTSFTQAAIDRWLERAWERTEKWGPCECLELPRKLAPKGTPRGHRAYLFAGWAAE